MKIKIIVSDYRQHKERKFVYIKYFHPRLNKFEYVVTLIFDKQKEEIEDKGLTWWSELMVSKLFEFFEKKYIFNNR